MRRIGILLFSMIFFSMSTQVHCFESLSSKTKSIHFDEFKNAVDLVVHEMQRADDRSAHCGFFSFSDPQGLTMVVNSSDNRTANVFIPQSAVVDLLERSDSTQASSIKTYQLSGQGTLKVIRSHSASYTFIGVMLSDQKSTVNCAVVSN